MSDNEAKEKILEAVQALLNEGCDAESLTVRQIAKKAGVGIGTVSYHYHSKDRLVFEAVGRMMANLAGEQAPEADGSASAYDRLRGFLVGTAEMALQYRSICAVQLSYDLVHGDMSICYHITPMLREIFGAGKSDLDIKLVALELVTTLQAIFLKPEAFRNFTGLEISNRRQREEALNALLQSVIKQ